MSVPATVKRSGHRLIGWQTVARGGSGSESILMILCGRVEAFKDAGASWILVGLNLNE